MMSCVSRASPRASERSGWTRVIGTSPGWVAGRGQAAMAAAGGPCPQAVRELGVQHGQHLGGEQLDAAPAHGVVEAAEVADVLDLVAERVVVAVELLEHLLRAADEVRAAGDGVLQRRELRRQAVGAGVRLERLVARAELLDGALRVGVRRGARPSRRRRAPPPGPGRRPPSARGSRRRAPCTARAGPTRWPRTAGRPTGPRARSSGCSWRCRARCGSGPAAAGAVT